MKHYQCVQILNHIFYSINLLFDVEYTEPDGTPIYQFAKSTNLIDLEYGLNKVLQPMRIIISWRNEYLLYRLGR